MKLIPKILGTLIFAFVTAGTAIAEVTIVHETETIESQKAVPWQRDIWRCSTDNGMVQVQYRRLLTPPEDGQRSLPNADSGIGFDGMVFGNWYRNNAIRVLVNGKDIMAQSPASSIETKEGERGIVRLEWEVPEKNGRFRLSVAVAPDGETIYVMGNLLNYGEEVRTLEVVLTAYPGGYAPSYGGKSHRMGCTELQSGEVSPELPNDSSAFTVLKISDAEPWVFLSDGVANSGAVGLLILPRERPQGEVTLSRYTVPIRLRYPQGTMTFSIALFAYATENNIALEQFKSELSKQQDTLESLAKENETLK